MIKKLKVTVVVENSTSIRNPELLGKHGLCLFLEVEDETGETTILMDTGPSPEVVLHNVNKLGLNLKKVNVVFLSHGHYDHTGGLIEVLKVIDRRTPIVVHPNVFSPKYTSKLRFVGLPFKLSEIENVGGRLILAKNPVKITENILTTGEIERKVEFEETKGFVTVENGIFKEDILMDDQALIVKVEGKGLIIFSGCAHAGIINTIKHAQKITGIEKVYGVLGGFHLENAPKERLDATIRELVKLKPKVVGPCHCTGLKAINQIANTLSEAFILFQTGDVVEF
ncbi:MBL fold metallo-hydrolase [Candidatus Bathyarchaeota archaeon]|nr:MAG: MBL fold metallo-hydrolase [Candidatus Bathyarchaeota archaeon]